MPGPYIPARDQDLAAWATNFESAIDTEYASYGLSSGQATAYTTAQADFVTKLATATDPATRTKVTVAAKDTSKALLVGLSRSYAMIAQAYPAITPSLLATAGLTVRSTVPTPIPAPVTVPLLSLLASLGQVVTLGYADSATPSAKKKPFGAIALQLVGKVSSTPLTDPDAVPTLKTVGRWPVSIQFTSDDIGKTVYIWGRWVTRKGLVGPWSSLCTAIVQA